MPACQVTDRLDTDVSGEHEVTGGDDLLRPALSRLGVQARAGEQPDDDEPRERLDQAVGAEANECNRTGSDACTYGNGELDDVPGVAAPREGPRPPL
jgi:hypothetical protein